MLYIIIGAAGFVLLVLLLVGVIVCGRKGDGGERGGGGGGGGNIKRGSSMRQSSMPQNSIAFENPICNQGHQMQNPSYIDSEPHGANGECKVGLPVALFWS